MNQTNTTISYDEKLKHCCTQANNKTISHNDDEITKKHERKTKSMNIQIKWEKSDEEDVI